MADDGEYGGEEEGNAPLLIHMVAGCAAGAIEATAAWPMEYIKTQLQLHHRRDESVVVLRRKASARSSSSSSSTSTAGAAPVGDGIWIDVVELGEGAPPEVVVETPPPYNGVVSGILYTVRTRGFFALYTGLTPTLLGSIPKAGIRFFLFAWFSDLLRDEDGYLSIWMCLLAGLAAGAFEALIVVVPVETVKTRCIQLNLPFVAGLGEILRVEGVRGVYRGVVATVLKQSSNHGLRFVWYYEYRRVVTHGGSFALTPWQAFLGGTTAGIFSAVGNQPFDVLKTRMQGLSAAASAEEEEGEERRSYSTWDCVRETYRREGVPGFYVGMVPRLCRVVPGQGIIFTSFEVIVAILLAITNERR